MRRPCPFSFYVQNKERKLTATATEKFNRLDWIPSVDFLKTATVESFQELFQRVIDNKENILQQLQKTYNAKELKVLAANFGSFRATQNTKPENAEDVFEKAILSCFTLTQGFFSYSAPVGGSMANAYELAVIERVKQITQEDIQKAYEAREAAIAQTRKMIENPETLEEFQSLVENLKRGYDGLTPDQQVQFDFLKAKQTKSERNKRTEHVEELSGDMGEVTMHLIQGHHAKKNIPLWICQMSGEVSRPVFEELRTKASQLDGWWSSFIKHQKGFQFVSEENAEKFLQVVRGEAVDRADVLEGRRIRKIQSRSERFRALADSLERSAIEEINKPRLLNTHKRAQQAASALEDARCRQAFAVTLRQLAEQMNEDDVTFLDGLYHATHVSELMSALRTARDLRNDETLKKEIEEKKLDSYSQSKRYYELKDREPDLEDVRYVEYPVVRVSRRVLQEMVSKAITAKGCRRAAQSMKKVLDTFDDSWISFRNYSWREKYLKFRSLCRRAGINTSESDYGVSAYSRLQAANIHTRAELRSALREFLPVWKPVEQENPAAQLERDLIGQKIPGFFPTPVSVSDRMLHRAGIESGQRVLEPSAGKGDILDAISKFCLDQQLDIELSSVEQNRTLCDILEAKGYEPEWGNFLKHEGTYDVILMNPPFERSQDAEHIRHAYDLLEEGGMLVSVACEGIFFRKADQEFRDWLDEVGAEVESLPDGAFNGPDAFRQTGVKTRLIYITK